ncbi:MAG: carboxypeptidase-like regulatory domain-containing protein [Longimicrobiales bacterium]
MALEEETGSGLEGVAVVALDSSGRRVLMRLTGPGGDYELRLPNGGEFVLRTDRIGYRTTTSARISVGTGDTIVHNLTISSQPVVLPALSVVADSRCDSPTSASTAVLWTEVRKTLELTSHAWQQDYYRYDVARFERQYGLDRRTVVSDRRWYDSTNTIRAFQSAEVETLLEGGFVQTQETETTYFGPDADVILSDSFLAEYCFFVVPGDDPDRIGLGFRPVKSHDVPQVEGVLWLGRESASLEQLSFSYVGLDVPGAETAGGEVEYDQVDSGRWIVRRWAVRAPILWLKDTGEVLFDGVREVGGRVRDVYRGGGNR